MTPLSIGMHLNISIEDYIADPAINKGSLMSFARSGQHYQHSKANPTTSDPMAIGSVTHTALLEKDQLMGRVILQPEEIKVRRGKTWEEFINRAEGKIILKADDYNKVIGMVEAVKAHPYYDTIFGGEGKNEVTYIFEHQGTGVLMKSRPDRVSNYVVGLKTSSGSVDARTFARQSANLKYHWSAYLEQFAVNVISGKLLPYIFVAVEQNPPHGVAMYEYSKEAIKLAADEIDLYMHLMQRCIENDVWPGYSTEVKTIDLPTYAYNQIYE